MTIGSSTLRSAGDRTVGDTSADGSRTLEKVIADEWQRLGEPDLISALRRHPQLLTQRSLLLNLAIDEYQARRERESDIDLELHCGRFRQFGIAVERSIMRQLEAQKYIDDNPGLLGLLNEPKWPVIGGSIAGFQIAQELGRGGVARVYLCHEPDIGNRQVVLKATPFGAFEASVLGRLNHPNIVPIFSTGFSEEHGLQYICMPYRGRSTLSDLVDVAFQKGVPRNDGSIAKAAVRWLPADNPTASRQGRRWTPRKLLINTYVGKILSIGVQLAHALEHAHERGIFHSDLKPSNVLLCSDGTPLLLDFNLSCDDERPLAAFGGTLPYMPPEQLRLVANLPLRTDSLSKLDTRSDIYSFGALMYELLTGRVVTTLGRTRVNCSTAANVLLRELREGIAPPSASNPFVGRRIDSLVLRCLEFDAEKRPKSIGEVRQALLDELVPVRSFIRQLKVRPAFYTFLAGLLITTGAASAIYVANRPPRHLAHYQSGLGYVAAGQTEQAVDSFSLSLSLKPDFRSALAARAKSRLTQGQVDLAMSDFGRLLREHDDQSSAASIAYCFNLKQIPTAAILWYENALEKGIRSAAIYNNLGATYLLARDRLSNADRYRRSEEYLRKAAEMLPSSEIVSLNIVRLETAKTLFDPAHNPVGAWQHADLVIKKSSNGPLAKHFVGRWYAAVLNREAQGLTDKGIRSVQENEARNRFAELVTVVTHKVQGLPPQKPKFHFKFDLRSNAQLAQHFYLRPYR